MYSKIVGTGSYLPKKVVANDDLCRQLDTTDEWITQRVGIKERRLVADESLEYLMKSAALNALEAANVSANDIDLFIVGTATPDYVFPSAACVLQRALGVTNQAPAFDVSAACAGFLYALNVADSIIKSGPVKRALVVGADAISKLVDWQDRSTCVLFGDGAGAVVIEASATPGVLSTLLHADGNYDKSLYMKSPVWNRGEQCHIKMDGKDVFRHATTKLGALVDQLISSVELDKHDIDWLIPHQANKRIIDAIAKKLALPKEKIIYTIEKHGNTSAASVPLALDHAVRSGKVLPGQLLMLEAFGGGFSWGGALVRY